MNHPNRSQESSPIIHLEGVCYAYQDTIALRYIDLDIRTGDCVLLCGSNGCGKSTLLRLINGLLFPNEGSYMFSGQPVTEKSMRSSVFSKSLHQKIGFVFQNSDTQLFCPDVEEEIAFGPVQMGLSEEEVRKRTDDMIRLFSLEKLRMRPPYHLSGGEKKKTALAAVLSMNPEVLTLDEPLAGLDKKTRAFLLDLLKKLHAAGKTLVIATHDPEMIRTLGGRVVEMDEEHRIVRKSQ